MHWKIRWFLSYKLGLCCFRCKYRGSSCKLHIGNFYFCGFCDNRIYDMCGHCVNRVTCGWPYRQKFSRPENWE